MKSQKGILHCSAVAASLLLLQPLTAQTPPPSPPPQPQTTEGSGPAAEGGQDATPPEGSRRTRKKTPRPGPPQPPPAEPPELDLIPPVEQQSSESVLDEIDDYGPAGDLAPSHPLFDELTIEFNKAVAQCDLKTFLEVRERYLAEIRRILSNPNLEKSARAHFERVLNAVEQTMVPIRAPMPCPILIR